MSSANVQEVVCVLGKEVESRGMEVRLVVGIGAKFNVKTFF